MATLGFDHFPPSTYVEQQTSKKSLVPPSKRRHDSSGSTTTDRDGHSQATMVNADRIVCHRHRILSSACLCSQRPFREAAAFCLSKSSPLRTTTSRLAFESTLLPASLIYQLSCLAFFIFLTISSFSTHHSHATYPCHFLVYRPKTMHPTSLLMLMPDTSSHSEPGLLKNSTSPEQTTHKAWDGSLARPDTPFPT